MAGQRKCDDDHSDFWVGPATPSLLTSWNFFPSFEGHTLANTVHPFHFFFIFHICALMGTLLMMDSVTGEAFSFICITFLLGFASTMVHMCFTRSHILLYSSA